MQTGLPRVLLVLIENRNMLFMWQIDEIKVLSCTYYANNKRKKQNPQTKHSDE